MKTQKDIDTNQEYKYGFTTDIESIKSPKGLNESTIKLISKKNLNGC
jgi:Fe-S cluster assembly protein SufB